MNEKMHSIKINGIEIKLDKKGNERAYYWSRFQFRRFPLPIDEAKMLLAAEFTYRTKF